MKFAMKVDHKLVISKVEEIITTSNTKDTEIKKQNNTVDYESCQKGARFSQKHLENPLVL